MLRRFVAAAVVASVATACAAIVVYFLPTAMRPRIFSVLLIWLCVPTVWGIWAMLAPPAWTPQRLPSWGALLGLLASLGASFVIDVPARFFGQPVSFRLHSVGVLAVVVFYYLLWMIVRAVWAALAAPTAEAGKAARAA